MRPSGYIESGSRYAKAFIKELPCDEIVQSYLGGEGERSFHNLTVASLEAETIREGWG